MQALIAQQILFLTFLISQTVSQISCAPPPDSQPFDSRSPTQFSPSDLLDSASRRKGIPVYREGETTSAESSMLLPIRGVGYTDFAGQNQYHHNTPHEPLKSHFSWDTSSVGSNDNYVKPMQTATAETRKSSIASLPSMSTRSASSVSSSFPFPEMTQPSHFSPVMETNEQSTGSLHHSPTHVSRPRPPQLAKHAAGERIPASHYRVLPSGDFYCEDCGHVFQNCHKIC